MKIVCIGGGPASLYFSILMKRADPSHEIEVFERNKQDDTFGFGVVFSDATLGALETADPESYRAITDAFYHWDDIEIHFQGEVLRSTGHGFAGLSRQRLLSILARRAEQLGVSLHFESEVGDPARFADADLILAADGVHSDIRKRFADVFEPEIDVRPNRFVWLGTRCPFPAFTFYFQPNEHGLWRVHAYQYEGGHSTFIVECTEPTFQASGLDPEDEDAAVAYCEQLFAKQLRSHRLLKNRSVWRHFPTIRNKRWRHDKIVLMGDAAHTAHFSVGSGTKLAMEDAIALAQALGNTRQQAAGTELSGPGIEMAVKVYERERRPLVESLQRAAQASLQWFEDAERYMHEEPIQFGFNLLTRSLRITHQDLKLRDPDYVAQIDRWFAAQASARNGVPEHEVSTLPQRVAPDVHSPQREVPSPCVPPPMFTPFKLRDMLLVNRVVVSPMCQYRAHQGTPDEWHLVHLGSRAVGGAGLIISEMTDIGPEARITPGCAGMWCDEHVAAWRSIVRFVHCNSFAKIALQLAHAGRKGATRVSWEGMDEPLERGGWPLLAASPIPWFPHSQVPKEMNRTDMDTVRDEFAAAAERAIRAEFDMLELHMAHGYLLATFISPLTNERDDEYGGSLENRMRFPLEVFDALRAVWPPERPISVRISAVDWVPGGIQPQDSVQIARLLAAHGCDLIDVSAGQTVPGAKPAYGRQFQTPFADRIRHEVGIATVAVGNISSYMDVNTILAAGRADLCALARAHLWDPYWTRNAAHKQGFELPWPDPYSVLDEFNPRFE